jgi:hypothetical protein
LNRYQAYTTPSRPAAIFPFDRIDTLGYRSTMSTKRRAALLVVGASLVAVGLVSGPGGDLGVAPAAACSCANGSAPALQPYGTEILRPRNARFRFSPIWNLPSYEGWARSNGFDGKRWDLALRRAGSPEVVATEQRVIGTEQERMLEIWPVAPLAPNAFYVVERRGEPADAKSPAGFATLHADFKTSAQVDTTPPSWSGASAARYLAKGVTGDRSSCNVQEPVIEIDAAEPKDDDTPATAIVLGVWVAGPTGAFDYAAAPAVLARLQAGHAYLGRRYYCGESDFPAKKAALKLGLRALDLAGNASAPSEVTVDPEGRPAQSSTASEPSSAPQPTRRWGCGKTSGPAGAQ